MESMAAATSVDALYASGRPRHRSERPKRNSIPTRWLCSSLRDVDSSGDHSRRKIVEHLPDAASASPRSAPALPVSSPLVPPSPSSSSQGIVLEAGTGGASWAGDRSIGSPVVKRFLSDDEERWLMWYHGRDGAGSDSVGFTASGNGVHWEKSVAPVLGRSSDWWAFDTGGIRPSEVLVMSSTRVRVSTAVYWLYYTGHNFSGREEIDTKEIDIDSFPISSVPNFMALPGLAISQDGRHWPRIEGEHHSGALLDAGAAGEWDSSFVAAPSVVYHRSGDIRMYYHSFDAESGCFCIGLARSRDGIRWMKLGKILCGGASSSFDEAGVLNANVVAQRNGGYLMAYEGVAANGRRSIGVAESEDGLKEWRRCAEGPVLAPRGVDDGEDAWDGGGVGCPCLVRMDGDEGWRLYYKGVSMDGRTGIGMAASLSQGSESPALFHRWMGFPL